MEYHREIGKNPNPVVMQAVRYVSRRVSALDLGAGNLRDSKFLKKQGFRRVVAVDGSNESRPFATKGIELVIEDIRTYLLPKNTFDLVVSSNVLLYLSHQEISNIARRVLATLRKGGIFACDVVGEEDDIRERISSFFTTDSISSTFHHFKMMYISDTRLKTIPQKGKQKMRRSHYINLIMKKT